ncbi:hypothetical protein TRFO_37026 [Tritrichomonas foetus]|uniref:Uncharacterized protein n=1 Tax=Tritrichomonas foetus TaxID=1144522 RepID=A0A1J4JHK6_9EUKA|nr:hypothetical protein TRFO_37026 [Tritrichomonas foetus]|eukprot:OHS96748.1 hypothetical protein TRFO_37026 [Tritrichomonas foetus]
MSQNKHLPICPEIDRIDSNIHKYFQAFQLEESDQDTKIIFDQDVLTEVLKVQELIDHNIEIEKIRKDKESQKRSIASIDNQIQNERHNNELLQNEKNKLRRDIVSDLEALSDLYKA